MLNLLSTVSIIVGRCYWLQHMLSLKDLGARQIRLSPFLLVNITMGLTHSVCFILFPIILVACSAYNLFLNLSCKEESILRGADTTRIAFSCITI